MATACVEPRPLYRPGDPQASDLGGLHDEHLDAFEQVYDERYQANLWAAGFETAGGA